jgi:transposase
MTVEVYLCTMPTDMRRGFDGLMRLAEEHLQRNVLQGGLFVFVNRHRDRVKLLYWDQDGLAIWYKRLERGTFAMPQFDEEAVSVILSATELAMLLGGADLKRTRKRNRYQIPA